jgi:ABC-2 type transport system ATP-binding protein
MWDEIRKLLREEKVTLLLTTHYLEEADQLAQRLAIVDRGLIVATGTPDELKRRLAGDRVSVQLAGEDGFERGKDLLRQVPGVHEVLIDGSQLHAQVAHGAQAVPVVLAALETAGLRVASVSLNRPSLDDVYLAATGHTFQAAGQ